MKSLIKQYLDRGISRRGFLTGLAALGISSGTAKAMARSLSPASAPLQQGGSEELPSWVRPMQGTGGALLVEQLKAAGIQYIFCNPSTGHAPIFDVLVDDPEIQLIKALQEGALAAMADGYAKASGKIPFVLLARPGVPNSMTQMFNSWKDQIPMVVATDYVGRGTLGQDGFEDTDHMEEIADPITKWHWLAETPAKIPEITRRALTFASTAPGGPVFVAYPEDILREEAKAVVLDQSKFTVSMRIRPDPALVEQAARMLLEARNPLLYVGDEIVWCGAQKEVVELAEVLGLPVTRPGTLLGWSMPFPTEHALYVGQYFAQSRYPGKVDVMLNLGSRMPHGSPPMGMLSSTKLIQVRLDATNLARVYPTDVAIVADLKLAIADLLAAIRSMATSARLKQISEPRMSQTREHTAQMREYRKAIGRERSTGSPISYGWLGTELESVLDRNTCFVSEVDSGRMMEGLLSFGGDDKQYFANGGVALGWGLPASFGVKLAHPDLPVVAAVGDGAFLFSGPQPLWSFARYQAAVTIIVLNNHSYDAERARIWGRGGRQTQLGRDMVCYLGDPDMDFVKMASSFGVEGEVVKDSSEVRPALERAKRATAQGSPYLLDVHVERMGLGAQSTWHPPFSIEALRNRRT
ncbi:MAG: thiamine pyrophosphate-binding protein [Acidobacteria bacterium]|nr:thiamine pyrophosphate-binding protein [Acidobacteriota bacterium]